MLQPAPHVPASESVSSRRGIRLGAPAPLPRSDSCGSTAPGASAQHISVCGPKPAQESRQGSCALGTFCPQNDPSTRYRSRGSRPSSTTRLAPADAHNPREPTRRPSTRIRPQTGAQREFACRGFSGPGRPRRRARRGPVSAFPATRVGQVHDHVDIDPPIDAATLAVSTRQRSPGVTLKPSRNAETARKVSCSLLGCGPSPVAPPKQAPEGLLRAPSAGPRRHRRTVYAAPVHPFRRASAHAVAHRRPKLTREGNATLKLHFSRTQTGWKSQNVPARPPGGCPERGPPSVPPPAPRGARRSSVGPNDDQDVRCAAHDGARAS